MNKTFILSIFLAFIAIPIASFGAETASTIPGCLPEYAFSPLSGKPCSGDLPLGCMPGYLFSSVTGKSCSEISEPVPTDDNVMEEETEKATELERERIQKCRSLRELDLCGGPTSA